jgi:outer membrane protein
MKKYLSPFALAALFAGTVAAQAETLEEALASTYVSNPTLIARRAGLRATDESVPQAQASWRPTITVSGTSGRGLYKANTSTPYYMNRSPHTQSLSISQPLYRGGRTTAATRQARNNVLAGRAQLTVAEQTALSNAAKAYLDVVRDEAVLRLSISNEQVLRRQHEAVAERFKAAQVTRTDISQAESRVAGAVSDRTAAEGTLQNSRANYFNMVGHQPESLVMPEGMPPVPASLAEVLELAQARNPAIVAAKHTHDAATDGIDLVAGELRPTVSLTGTFSRSAQATNQESDTRTHEVVVSVSVPLYEGGGTYARLRASKQTASQRKTEIDQAWRDTTEAATRAWEGLQSARAQVTSLEQQTRASELALEGVEEEAKVGARTVLDVLNGQQELFAARVNLVKARHDMFVAAFQVRTAVGQMTAEALALPVELYDPTKHFDEVDGKWFGWEIEDDSAR